MRKTIVKLAAASTTAAVTLAALTTAVMAQWSYSYDYAPAGAGLAFGGAWALFVCCAIICGLAVNFLIAFFIYRDAQKYNVENPILWAAVGFLFTVVGLLIYLLAIRPDAVKKMEGAAPTKAE